MSQCDTPGDGVQGNEHTNRSMGSDSKQIWFEHVKNRKKCIFIVSGHFNGFENIEFVNFWIGTHRIILLYHTMSDAEPAQLLNYMISIYP